MFKEKEIKAVKKTIPPGITYALIAKNTNGKASLDEVKKFYSFKNVAFDKAKAIVISTKDLVQRQTLEAKQILSA